MFKLVGITQGRYVPSTRFRWTQYFDDLQKGGFEVFELPSLLGAYPPSSHMQRPIWLAAALVEGFMRTVGSCKYSLRFLQRNLTSTLCTWEPLLRKPFVFDVDDAIFLGSRGDSSNRIAKSSSLIICGNDFLANHFTKFGATVVLPTAIDTHRFQPGIALAKKRQVIGWTGSSSNLQFLYQIESALLVILLKYPDVILKIVSDKAPVFEKLPLAQVIFEKWLPKREAAVLHEFDIGIMPLEDNLWARGKCSFKMLMYMSVAIPVVVSPIGMNLEILNQSNCGFGPKNQSEWVDALACLLTNTALASVMGQEGRKLVELRYAKNIVGPKLAHILKSQLSD